jgi:hypothetical protein
MTAQVVRLAARDARPVNSPVTCWCAAENPGQGSVLVDDDDVADATESHDLVRRGEAVVSVDRLHLLGHDVAHA